MTREYTAQVWDMYMYDRGSGDLGYDCTSKNGEAPFWEVFDNEDEARAWLVQKSEELKPVARDVMRDWTGREVVLYDYHKFDLTWYDEDEGDGSVGTWHDLPVEPTIADLLGSAER